MTCLDCDHYYVCSIAKRFQGTIQRNARHWKVVKSQPKGISVSVLGCVAKACYYYKKV